jgi:hypothetical protein
MSAEVDATCSAPLGERSADGPGQPANGHQERRLDTRVGTLPLAFPSCARVAIPDAHGRWRPTNVALHSVTTATSARSAGRRGSSSQPPGTDRGHSMRWMAIVRSQRLTQASAPRTSGPDPWGGSSVTRNVRPGKCFLLHTVREPVRSAKQTTT